VFSFKIGEKSNKFKTIIFILKFLKQKNTREGYVRLR